eukprot:489832_1
MSTKKRSISIQNLILKSKHISNAMCHELYDKISHKFTLVIDQNIFETVEGILNALKHKTKIDDNEIKGIEQLIERAMNFFYPHKENHIEDIVHFVTDESFDFNILSDIYNVHNAFLFMNFNFQSYEPAAFIQDINNSKEINNTLKSPVNSQTIESIKFNLFCPFIIDDDMYSICNYFFAGSHLANKLNQ